MGAAGQRPLVWSTAEGQTLDSVFFPGTRRRYYETTPAGVYRNVLAQLYKQDPRPAKCRRPLCRAATRPVCTTTRR